MLEKFKDLPEYMQIDEVKEYYDILNKKRFSLLLKRIFDFSVALISLIILFPILILISILIVLDSKGGAIFSQERVTTYGKKFKIYKFRTMTFNAESLGSSVTTKNDRRITRIGYKLRKYRIDELPQLFNILLGDMSFVGTRPELTKYVNKYKGAMFATLLLPAGVTSKTSILYKDEEKLLSTADDVDKVYVEKILPEKMKYNLECLKRFGFLNDIRTMIETVVAVIR